MYLKERIKPHFKGKSWDRSSKKLFFPKWDPGKPLMWPSACQQTYILDIQYRRACILYTVCTYKIFHFTAQISDASPIWRLEGWKKTEIGKIQIIHYAYESLQSSGKDGDRISYLYQLKHPAVALNIFMCMCGTLVGAPLSNFQSLTKVLQTFFGLDHSVPS